MTAPARPSPLRFALRAQLRDTTRPADFFGERAGLGASLAQIWVDGEQTPRHEPVAGLPAAPDHPAVARLFQEAHHEPIHLTSGTPELSPLFENGLVASADGLTWVSPGTATAGREWHHHDSP